MLRTSALVVALGLAVEPPLQAAIPDNPVAPIDPDARCPKDTENKLIVTVVGMKDARGKLRVELYPDDENTFLKKPISRVAIKAHGRDVSVCLPKPSPGLYAIVVLHDRNQNGHVNVFSDGFGFSNNPRLGLGVPKLDKVIFATQPGVQHKTVVLNYMHGLRPKPIDQ